MTDTIHTERLTKLTQVSSSRQRLTVYLVKSTKGRGKKNHTKKPPTTKRHMKGNGQMSLSSFVAEPRKLCSSATSSTFHPLDHSSYYSICPYGPFAAAEHYICSSHTEEARPTMFIQRLSILVSFSP